MIRAGSVLWAFSRQGAKLSVSYGAAFWTELANVAVKIFAFVLVWQVLANEYGDRFPATGGAAVSYIAMTQLTAGAFTWWAGAHFRIQRQVRDGTVHVDLLRPINFPLQLTAWELGESVTRLCLMVIPVSVPLFLLLDLDGPPTATAAVAFPVSVILAFLVLAGCNFLVGLIVIRTLSLKGVQQVYHAAVTLLSGLWIPLWLYPDWLAAITAVLPFRSIFYAPAAIFVGYVDGAGVGWTLLTQLGWAIGLGVLGQWGWARTRAHITSQGG